MRKVSSRISRVENVLDAQIQATMEEAQKWLINQPERDQQAMFRWAREVFGSDQIKEEKSDEAQQILYGGLPYQDSDLEIAGTLFKRMPKDLIWVLKME